MKTRRGQIISVSVVLLIAFGSLAYTFLVGNAPLLGLDLQGGLSVVLKPKQAVSEEQTQQAIAIIRQRIDAIGVAEPEISQQGDNILIQIPGVEDKERALQLVGQTAELRFRPVLSYCKVASDPTATTAPPASAPPTSAADPNAPPTSAAPTDPNAPPTSAGAPGAPASSVAPTPAPSAPAPAASTPSAPGQGALGGPLVEGESAAGAPGARASLRDGPIADISGQQPAPQPSVAPAAPAQPAPQVTVAPTAPGQPATVPGQPTAVPGQAGAVPGQPTAVPGQTGSPATAQQSLSPEQQAQLQQQALQQQGQQPVFQPGAPCPPGVQATPADQDKADQPVILPGFEDDNDPKKLTDFYQLGPANATGSILQDASGALSQQGAKWVVRPRFKAGADGIDKFNASAQICKPAGAQCPTGRQAMTLDGRVISAPSIQPQEQAFKPFSADQVEISGNFTENSAKELATQLKYGALPVELVQQQAQEVSATLGRDALRAGLISGFVGLALVAIYMTAFYRLLGAMAVFKLVIEGAIIYSFIAFLGTKVGLALTLAGVTGLIVSIGVSLDSNVVYYEHLKEDLRNGRTLRSSVDKAFKGSFKTILKADGVSMLGAALLYMLSVGPVRGFAFYLILAMVLDLLTSRWYMYPAVLLVCRSKLAVNRPGLFGLPGADAATDRPGRPSARGIPSRPSKNKDRSPVSTPTAGDGEPVDDAEADASDLDTDLDAAGGGADDRDEGDRAAPTKAAKS